MLIETVTEPGGLGWGREEGNGRHVTSTHASAVIAYLGKSVLVVRFPL